MGDGSTLIRAMVVSLELQVNGDLKRRKHLLSKEAVVTMINRHFQHDDNLAMTVLEIIGHYQPIPTMDIWYELGEDGRFEDCVALAEVNDILAYLENEKRIIKKDGDKWSLKGYISKTRMKTSA